MTEAIKSTPVAVVLPSPSFTGANPANLTPGTTTSVTLQGTNLDQVSNLTINGLLTPFTAISASGIQVGVTVAAWAQGTVSFVGLPAANTGRNSTPYSVSIVAPPVTYDAAVRFLQQAGFGATPALITQVQAAGFSSWIDTQVSTAAYDYTSTDGLHNGQYYRNTQNGALSLRQRVSLALDQIFVVGSSSVCEPGNCGPLWENLIEQDAFGNVRTLLNDVALSPIMGAFLNNGRNFVGATGGVANQNFAREFMQVMTIGTVMLQANGSPVLDSAGNAIPTYTQSNIVAMASAVSGWYFPTASGYFSLATATIPMEMNDGRHDQESKNILPGVTLPAGPGGVADMNAVLDALYNHQNIGPFLSRRLIQHLVKSNPSSAYVARISAVFADDGKSVRGNLAAVVKAILLDSEARIGDDNTVQDPSAGHLMEPILFLADTMNTLGGVFTDDEVRTDDAAMDQQLYFEPSVFAYYSPDHQLTEGAFAPEAQLLDNAHALAKMSVLYNILQHDQPGFTLNLSGSPFWNAASQSALLDQINHLLMHGNMSSDMRTALLDYMAQDSSKSVNAWLPDILFMTLSSSSYQVIR